MKLAFHASGDYLHWTIRNHPATPTELARAANDLVNAYHRVILYQLGEASDSEIDLIRRHIRASELALRGECDD